MNLTYDLQSPRARQAQAGRVLRASWVRGVLVVMWLLGIIAAGWLLLNGITAGWFVLGLSGWSLMPLLWYEWHLKNLPPSSNPQRIDDVLDGEVLARLRPQCSPRDLAECVMQTNGGLFFALRLGIGPNFLRDMSSTNPADTASVWRVALEQQRILESPQMSSAILTTALISVLPQRDSLLARLQLAMDDVEATTGWFHHLLHIIEIHEQRKYKGGIGRDLSFGYTPLLNRFAQNISLQVGGDDGFRDLEGREAILQQLMQQLARGGRQNAVMVGTNGVGKTTLVYSLAERLIRGEKTVPADLRFRQVMALDPANLIAAARGRGELEGLVNQLLNEAYSAKNVVLYFDNAELFFSDKTGAVDLRNILLPALESGVLRVILSMDEQQWLSLSRATPNLTQQLNRMTIPPLGREDTLRVCEDHVLLYEFRYKVTYMYQSLITAYRLGERYVADMAMPGQALQVLEAAAQMAENGLVTAASVERAIEKNYGIKVATARAGDERETLLNLEDLLHQRMINQKRAVAEVANALRRARSGVRNQNRPIGSFLFLGPTGVGKTELAKALAAVYFGGEDRMVRLDLNEFGQATDVARLIADGASDSRSLTAQIAKQPFSVVLLDEIEKAHPNVLNTLLQLLDEGILRDERNREVSFRDAVIIATSNAGADRIRQYIDAGYAVDQFEEKFVSELIDSGQFKPEFLNRFDEISVFRPLSEDELLQVVDLMLAGINKTLAQQHISVAVSDEAKRVLVHAGYDPRLGARPMRRVVQRSVENIVAKRLLEGTVAPGEVIQLPLEEINQVLQK